MNKFFAELKAFTDFQKVATQNIYTDLPDDWLIAVGDVAGSTKAIEAGRYKDVNTLGAALIVAALNAAKGIAIPYVFGGDGATLAYPDSLKGAMAAAFGQARAMAQQQFNMDLRVGVFKVQYLRAKGFPLQVAKYQLSGQVTLAMFRGEGFKQAEFLLKDPTSRLTYELEAAQTLSPEFFNGLECRWNPIPPKHDVMLTLIVQAKSEEIFNQVLAKVDQLLTPAPISEAQIPISWPPKFLGSEVRVRTAGLGPIEKLIYWIQALGTALVGYFVMKKKGKIGNFDSQKYLADLVKNSDYRKFDEALRMVLDCTTAQADLLEEWLDKRRIAGDLYYGGYRSPTALMTCMVFSWENHVHFIDGSDGGYALAAKQLKSQLYGR